MPSNPVESPFTKPFPVVVARVDPPYKPSCGTNPIDAVEHSHKDELRRPTKGFCDQHAVNNVPNVPINVAHTLIAGVT